MGYYNHSYSHQVIRYGANHKKQLLTLNSIIKPLSFTLEDRATINPSQNQSNHIIGFMSSPSNYKQQSKQFLNNNLYYIKIKPPYYETLPYKRPDICIMIDTAIFFIYYPHDLVMQNFIIELYKKIHPFLPLIIPTLNQKLKKNYIENTNEIPLKDVVNKMYNDFSSIPFSLVKKYYSYPSVVSVYMHNIDDTLIEDFINIYPLFYTLYLYPQKVITSIKNNKELHQHYKTMFDTIYLGKINGRYSASYDIKDIIKPAIYYTLYNQKSEREFNEIYSKYEQYFDIRKSKLTGKKNKAYINLLEIPQLASNFVFIYLTLMNIDDMAHIEEIHKRDPTLITDEEYKKIRYFNKYFKINSGIYINQEAIDILLKLKQDNIIQSYNKILRTNHNNIHSHIIANMLKVILNKEKDIHKGFYKVIKELNQEN